MIGRKRLGEVRASLLEECAKADKDPDEWFADQIQKLERSPSQNAQEIETLKLIRDGLRSPPSVPKRKRGRTRSAG